MDQNESVNPTPDSGQKPQDPQTPPEQTSPPPSSEPAEEAKTATEEVLTPPPPPAGEPSQEDKNMGLLCHLLGLFTSFLGPLIIWLIKKDQSAYVNDQGKEALNFQITVIIAWFIAYALMLVVVGIFLMPVILILNLVFCIMGCVAAAKGRPYRYPVSIRLIK